MLTENIFNFGSIQIRSEIKTTKIYLKETLHYLKSIIFMNIFLPIFVIFIEQIIVKKIETSGSHSG